MKMNNNTGWIKLHRKIIQNGFAKKPDYLSLWVHLLLNANHKENEFLWNNEKMIVPPGSFLTGRKKLSEQTGINESKIERILKYFENEQQIEQQKTTKFRVICIKNWEKYQFDLNSEQQNEQQVNNKRTTSEQQMNTNKNDKNDKNDKNEENMRGLPAKFWRKHFLSNPGVVELDLVTDLIKKFGNERAEEILYELRSKLFRKPYAMRNAIDWNTGKIKPKGGGDKKLYKEGAQDGFEVIS